MADYTTGCGNAGTMLIRDNGNWLQFFIRSADGGTYIGSPGIGTRAYIDDGWRALHNLANYSNSVWQELSGNRNGTNYVYNANYNQNVCFQVDNTGTWGLGDPPDFWQYIQRATVPAAPTPIGIDNIQHTQFRYRFSGNSDGGSPIREWQIGYGYDPNNVQYTAASNGTIDVGTFTVGARIYIWSRGRNDVGWGPWSSRMDAQLLRGLKLQVSGTWRDVIPYAKVAGVWRVSEPYVKVAGTWKVSVQ